MEKPASDTSPTPSRAWGDSPVKPQAHVSRPTAFLLPEGQQSQEARWLQLPSPWGLSVWPH